MKTDIDGLAEAPSLRSGTNARQIRESSPLAAVA